MERIPLTFEHKGKQYKGELMPVAGRGSTQVWHLMINNYYYGALHCNDGKWIFHSTKMPEIADLLGEYVIAWYQ